MMRLGLLRTAFYLLVLIFISRFVSKNPKWMEKCEQFIPGIYIGFFFVSAGYYLFSPGFLDHIEPTIASIAYLFNHGKPLYHGPNDSEIYSIIYSPNAFWINAQFLKILPVTVWATKIPGFVFSIGAFALFAGITRKTIPIGLYALYMLMLTPFSIWSRPDPSILFFAMLGLLALTKRSSLLLGFALGMVINLKINHFGWFLPMLGYQFLQLGMTSVFLSLAVAAVFSVLPFLHLQVDFNNYFLWLKSVAGQGFDAILFLDNLDVIFKILIPVVLLAWMQRPKKQKKEIWFLGGLFIIGLVPILAGASKVGSSSAHLLSLGPVALFFVFEIWHIDLQKFFNSPRRMWLSFYLLLMLAGSVTHQIKLRKELIAQTWGSEALLDIEGIEKKYSGLKIHMGYSEPYELSFYRFALVANGNPYILDSVALMDLRKSGGQISEQVISRIENCAADIWLFPKGSEPFVLSNWYAKGDNLFSPEFIARFYKSHKKVGESKYYSIYRCQATVAQSGM